MLRKTPLIYSKEKISEISLPLIEPQQLGITGWMQINGRNAITWEEKFKLDVWYVDNWSLWLDIKIIGMTIWKILKREGISHPGQATMQEFMGSKCNG
jgi:sugar transferase EpsL